MRFVLPKRHQLLGDLRHMSNQKRSQVRNAIRTPSDRQAFTFPAIVSLLFGVMQVSACMKRQSLHPSPWGRQDRFRGVRQPKSFNHSANIMGKEYVIENFYWAILNKGSKSKMSKDRSWSPCCTRSEHELLLLINTALLHPARTPRHQTMHPVYARHNDR
jgi:hypothetical protein